MNKTMLVSVGLPTLGREVELVNTIKMVLGQHYKNIELIVADQTTEHTEETSNFIAEAESGDKRLRYFKITPQNLPAARNFILEKAKGKLILFIDDDIEIAEHFVDKHVQSHREHPEAIAIGGRIIQDKVPLSENPVYFDEYALPHGTFNCPKSGYATSFPGGNHSVMTSALKKIGGYHTSYNKIAIREESDTASRLMKAGYKIYFDADAPIIHLATPYGGCRIYINQYDNLWFFVNDLFFTLRVVRPNLVLKALAKKYCLYTNGSTLKNTAKRNAFFLCGLMIALWMYFFKPTHKAHIV